MVNLDPGHLAHACLGESDDRSNPKPQVKFATTADARANTIHASARAAYNEEDDTIFGRDREWVESLIDAALQNESSMLR